MSKKAKLAVVAIGGNSLIRDKKFPGLEYQWQAVRETCSHLADMVEDGWDMVVTHGNGPQVGFILRRNELAAHELHTTSLDVIGADTQGSIGYMLQQSLGNEFKKRGVKREMASLVTQTLVDAHDPAFQRPTKPIGGYLSEEEAEAFRSQGWTVVEDSGRGLRRVVASPQPLRIIESNIISSLAAQGVIVIAAGGGGIPVVEDGEGDLSGTYAVIDKDRATALLAAQLKADLLLISTGVEQVALNFNKPEQRFLDEVSAAEARQYMEEGHFAEGSMKPKIEASLTFLESSSNDSAALITDPANIARALRKETGTWIRRV